MSAEALENPLQPPRTYHHRDFDASDLARRKREAGLQVAVVIPARNEEAHVGRVVSVLRETVVERHGLVDDLLVVDGDSQDHTGAVAAAAGARVVRQSEVLPEAGSTRGKGEALWKGLAATTADLVCFVDADIQDIDQRFVVGLLGPLLMDEAIEFTKACYDRPLDLGSEVRPSGGGRVTELLARPLLAAFWPELAWLAQPLSGEYAGRRELLESVPFCQGYGVEIGLLVDIASTRGAEVIAQVDLDRRRHDHQPLPALGRMAAEILAVAMGRLEQSDRLILTEPMSRTLLQPERIGAELVLEAHMVQPGERPPLAEWRAQQAMVRPEHD